MDLKKLNDWEQTRKWNESNKEVFTVGYEMIPANKTLNYNIYINSSNRKGVEHFVCIIKKGRSISDDDIHKLIKKYDHLYVLETERSQFLSNLAESNQLLAKEKVEILKDHAINYLNDIFSHASELNTKSLNSTLEACHSAVLGMLYTIKDYDIYGLHELIAELNFHDHYTFDHSINTAMYNMMTYRALNENCSNSQLITVGLCGMFHDIGKIQLPNHVINASKDLTEKQYELIRKHPSWGKDFFERKGIIIEAANINLIKTVAYQHHENYNGSGYPEGLSGNEIDLIARMTSISDFFDAITTKRSYHHALNPEQALLVMKNTCGKKIDPILFKLFAQKIMGFEYKSTTKLFLPDNFDPCQPHDHLPFEIHNPKPWNEWMNNNFGNIILK